MMARGRQRSSPSPRRRTGAPRRERERREVSNDAPDLGSLATICHVARGQDRRSSHRRLPPLFCPAVGLVRPAASQQVPRWGWYVQLPHRGSGGAGASLLPPTPTARVEVTLTGRFFDQGLASVMTRLQKCQNAVATCGAGRRRKTPQAWSSESRAMRSATTWARGSPRACAGPGASDRESSSNFSGAAAGSRPARGPGAMPPSVWTSLLHLWRII